MLMRVQNFAIGQTSRMQVIKKQQNYSQNIISKQVADEVSFKATPATLEDLAALVALRKQSIELFDKAVRKFHITPYAKGEKPKGEKGSDIITSLPDRHELHKHLFGGGRRPLPLLPRRYPTGTSLLHAYYRHSDGDRIIVGYVPFEDSISAHDYSLTYIRDPKAAFKPDNYTFDYGISPTGEIVENLRPPKNPERKVYPVLQSRPVTDKNQILELSNLIKEHIERFEELLSSKTH